MVPIDNAQHRAATNLQFVKKTKTKKPNICEAQ